MSDTVLYMIAAIAAGVLGTSVWYLIKTRPKPRKKRGSTRPGKRSSSAPGARKSSRPPPKKRPGSPKPLIVPLSEPSDDDDDPEITIVRLQHDPSDFPELIFDEDDERPEPIANAVPIIADEGAEEDEPTRTSAVILVSAAGHSDVGQRRRRNEDRYLRLDTHGVYAVADGMGGHAGGATASQTAVESIEEAFKTGHFEGKITGSLPRRAEELARSVQMANVAIFNKACAEPHLEGMGTTLVAVRFALRKERLYLAHVGDSRCYRIRANKFEQLTTDHTLGNLGMTGPHAEYLSRAVGIKPDITIDVIVGKPQSGDLYLLCSDGLNKMVPDEEIPEIIQRHSDIQDAVSSLIDLANERGGRDNVTVLIVAVRSPSEA